MKKLLSISNILEEREVKLNMKRVLVYFNNMPFRMVIHIIVTIVIVFSVAICPAYPQAQGTLGTPSSQAGGLTRPSSVGTLGPFTSPVSSYLRSTTPSPTYQADAGNMLITGNVGGGRQFRGSVPYTAPRDFRASLPTTSIDSFLRYSTPSGQTFYSPTASPLSTNPVGIISVPRPRSSKIQEFGGNETFLTSPFQAKPPQTVTSVAGATPLTEYGFESNLLGRTQENLLARTQAYETAQQFIPAEISREQLLSSEQVIIPQQPQEFNPDQTKLNININIRKPSEATPETTETAQTLKTLPETNFELDSIRKIIQEQVDKEEANQLIEKAISDKWQSQLEEAEKPVGLQAYRDRAARRETPSAQTTRPVVQTLEEEEEETVEQPAKTVQDVNIYEKEFNEKMREAQKFMKEGKFYKAVDAYTYATLYKPMEPSGYVGKAIALSAAGEYMSSSQLLYAGLKLSPDYAKVKQNFGILSTDKNKFLARITDLDKSVVASGGKADLLYLLAYVCFQTDQTAKAQQAIGLAVKAAPDDTTIADLRKIIDETRAAK